MQWILLILLITLAVLGFISIRYRIARLADRTNFVSEYRTHFETVAQNPHSEEASKSAYWLNHRLPRMNKELGAQGLMSYKPPFSRVLLPNYAILPNTLQEIITGNGHTNNIHACVSLFVQQLGRLDDEHSKLFRRIINPLHWVLEGTRVSLAFPVYVLEGAGLISNDTAYRISNGFLFRMLALLVSFVNLFSAVLGIVLGWKAFSDLLINFLL